MTQLGADCHVHIFDDAHSFIANPRYVAHPSLRGTATQLQAVLDAHQLSHALLVAAAPYGGNNGPVLDAIKAARGRFKGIALLPDPEVSDRHLQRMDDQGIVGVRVNLALGQQEITGAAAARLFARMHEMGWFLEIHCEEGDLLAAKPILSRSRVQLLLDHCGRPDATSGLGQPGFQYVLELGRTGRAVAKLSGAFRFSRQPYPYADTDAFFESVIAAYGLERCVWGSDWPFVNMDERVDYGPVKSGLQRWLPNAGDRHTVLWDTPSCLFGFVASD